MVGLLDGRQKGGHIRRVEERVLSQRLLRQRIARRLQPLAHLAFEPEQRAHRVHRDAAVRRLAKDIVEDFQRQRAGVSGAHHLLEEAHHVEMTLARKIAVVACPLDHVHSEQRRIGHLHEDDPVARDLREA